MRLILLTPYYSPGVGGSARVLQEIVDFLTAKGHQITVITFGDSHDLQIQKFDTAQPYQIIRILPYDTQGLKFVFMAIQTLRVLLKQRIGLIFCGVAYSSAIVAYFALRIFKVPYVVYSHGEDVTCVKKSPRKTKLLETALGSAAFVMANSSFTLREVRALGVPEAKSSCIPPGLITSHYANPDITKLSELKRKLNLPDGKILLTVARLDPRKGHDMVIRSLPQILKSVPDVTYLIIGKGDQTELRKLASDLGVINNIIFYEYVSDDDLTLIYHLCDLYIMVSRWDPIKNEVEGFGIVYLEAGASGKPCVAGSAGGCSDIVLNGVTGLVVDPEKPTDIAAAVLSIILDPERANQFGQAARERVTKVFDSTVTLAQTEQVILSIH